MKPDADQNYLNNYRPITNLPLLPKTIEKCVLAQLNNHIEKFNLHDSFQSGVRKGCSTETAMLNITDNLHRSLDDGQACLLALLELSAAFDTVNNDILLNILPQHAGINDHS